MLHMMRGCSVLLLVLTAAFAANNIECDSKTCAGPSPPEQKNNSSVEQMETVTLTSTTLLGTRLEPVWNWLGDFAKADVWNKECANLKIIKGRGNVEGSVRECGVGNGKVVREKLTKRISDEFKMTISTQFRGSGDKNDLHWTKHNMAIELFPVICGSPASSVLRLTATFEVPSSKVAIAKARQFKDFTSFIESVGKRAKFLSDRGGLGGIRMHNYPKSQGQHLWLSYACIYDKHPDELLQATYPTSVETPVHTAYFPPNSSTAFNKTMYRRQYHLHEFGKHGYGSHWVEDVFSIDRAQHKVEFSMDFTEASHFHIQKIKNHSGTMRIHRLNHMPVDVPNPDVVGQLDRLSIVVYEHNMLVDGADTALNNRAFWTYWSDQQMRLIKNMTLPPEVVGKVSRAFTMLTSLHIDEVSAMFNNILAIQDIFTGFTGSETVRLARPNRVQIRAKSSETEVKLLQYEVVESPANTDGSVRTFRFEGVGHLHWLKSWSVAVLLSESSTSEYRAAHATHCTVILEYLPSRFYKPGAPFGDIFLLDPSTVMPKLFLRFVHDLKDLQSVKHRIVRANIPAQDAINELLSDNVSWLPHTVEVLGVNPQRTSRWLTVRDRAPMLQSIVRLPKASVTTSSGTVETFNFALMWDPPHHFHCRLFLLEFSVKPFDVSSSHISITSHVLPSVFMMHTPKQVHDDSSIYIGQIVDKLHTFLRKRATNIVKDEL
jgi:hypothetical protein